MFTILWLGMSYVVGAIPFGLLLTKMRGLPDPRKHGSRNMGATNVARVCGTGCGVATLLLDMLKGFFPVAVAVSFSNSWFFITLTALAVLLGHMYSVFLSGKGGKGAATTVGLYLGLAFWPTFLGLLVCLTVIKLGGFVSLGSLTLVTLMPILLLLTGMYNFLPLSLLVMILVYARHKDNIQRLAKGEEQPWRCCA
ncbi:acyl-phosphate glycerol-3-phosphate acyltransferase [Desulfonatronum thiosulfatophilum]|uniref:Glycerol-3-phosphate acyltransferase n=1 Tax=Desulfonatronum thiosulfatophilum TaxID=617002 RepID=A0A1G6A1W7_9BACT|nr:glycerol-3-phosphate 1-O-acyltransferase PlsY [Desulfonatronum thiosulfatophilum]SDB02424.1 acyl-phosphate glycerol-3-phosphate acyltransferase [Desulfonatronum thiosulfatophilum]